MEEENGGKIAECGESSITPPVNNFKGGEGRKNKRKKKKKRPLLKLSVSSRNGIVLNEFFTLWVSAPKLSDYEKSHSEILSPLCGGPCRAADGPTADQPQSCGVTGSGALHTPTWKRGLTLTASCEQSIQTKPACNITPRPPPRKKKKKTGPARI